MKPTLFIVGGSSTALEIRETVDQFFKDKYFAVYNVISDEESPILQTYIRDSSLLDRLSTIEVSHYIIGFTNRTLRLGLLIFLVDLTVYLIMSFIHLLIFLLQLY